MKKPVCWIVRLEEGVRQETRVSFLRNSLKWQFKRSDEERWDYDRAPTPEEWERLEEAVLNRYQRRAIPYKDLELVRQLRKQG